MSTRDRHRYSLLCYARCTATKLQLLRLPEISGTADVYLASWKAHAPGRIQVWADVSCFLIVEFVSSLYSLDRLVNTSYVRSAYNKCAFVVSPLVAVVFFNGFQNLESYSYSYDVLYALGGCYSIATSVVAPPSTLSTGTFFCTSETGDSLVQFESDTY